MRPTSETAVSLKDFTGLFFALVAVALAAVLLMDFSWKQEDADERIDHTMSIYVDSQQLLVGNAQANTNIRNYIMTSNPKYLAHYEQSKTSLQRETNSLMARTRSQSVRDLIQQRLAPDLKTFLAACDQLAASNPAQVAQLTNLQQLEAADEKFDQSLEMLQTEELRILEVRKENVLKVSNRMGQIRTLIMLVAFLAILNSIITLRTVMKKDRQKIEQLQAAVERTQEAQQAASDALAEAHRSNELKTQFMANTSHEIRTPMTGILGLADLLRGQNLSQPAHDHAQVLFDSAQQLLAVLNDLLNFSQLEKKTLTLDRKPFAVRQTLQDVTAMVEHDLREKNLTINVAVDKSVPPIVLGDEDKIRRVIYTFVANSIKFTSAGGIQILVQTSDNSQVKVAVIDTGIGIDSQDLDKIFLPFVQADGGIRRTHGGTGLSLTIAKRLIDMMSGEIGVLSEPGGGSIFWFTFSGANPNA